MKTIKTLIIIITYILAAFGLISVVLFILGYKPIINSSVYPNWEAISAFGEWAGALVAIAIPFAIFILDKRMKQRSDETQDKLLKELTDFKSDYEDKLKALSTLVNKEGDIVIDGGSFEVKNVNPEWQKF